SVAEASVAEESPADRPDGREERDGEKQVAVLADRAAIRAQRRGTGGAIPVRPERRPPVRGARRAVEVGDPVGGIVRQPGPRAERRLARAVEGRDVVRVLEHADRRTPRLLLWRLLGGLLSESTRCRQTQCA